MESPLCDEVRAFVRAVPDPTYHRVALDRLADHVAGCARCRGTLALFAAALVVPLPPTPPTAESWGADLATYMDRETTDGVVAAARAFPHVWWALWTDPDCAALYEGMCALRDAAAQGELTPLQLRPSLVVQPLYLIPQAALYYGMGAGSSAAYRAVRGSSDDPVTLLDNEDTGDYCLSLSIATLNDERVVVEVRVQPVVAAQVVLTIQQQQFHAPFDTNGTAIVSAIPGALLRAPDGTGLEIGIVLDE